MNKADWQTVISDYDPRHETIKGYCARLHISTCRFYAMRKELRKETRILPVTVERSSAATVKINHVTVSYDDSISDDQLRRLIRLCAEV